MKKQLIILGISILSFSTAMAQNVGINADGSSPDASAMLDVKDTKTGLLIPRVDISDLTTAAPVTSPATSLLVYNTNTTTGPGYFYWDGIKWVKLFDINDGKFWKLTGNAGTTAGTNFLGTTDAQDFVIKTSGNERIRVTSGGFVGINTTPTTLFDVDGGTSSTTQTIATITGNSLTSGKGLLIESSSLTSGYLVDIEATNSTDNSANTNAGLYINNTGPYANAIQAVGAGRPNYSAVFATSTPIADGTGYSVSTSNHTINSVMNGSHPYSFAVYGRIVNAPNPSGGVIGYYASDDLGILGYNNGAKTGVVGIGGTGINTLSGGSGGAFSSDNVGVFGYGDNTSSSVGVYGKSDATDGTGVIGICTNDMGVYGQGDSVGVYGLSNIASGSGDCAVLGINENASGDGIIGIGSNSPYYGSSGNGDGVIGTTDNSSAYGVAGYYYDGSDLSCSGYLGSSTIGVYGSMGKGTYSAYFDVSDPSSMAAVVIDDNGVSDPQLRPSEAGSYGNWGWGLVGTSTYWWDKMYSESYYANDGFYYFDTYDDLTLLNAIKGDTLWDPILKHDIMKIKSETLPHCITNYSDIAEGKAKNVFVNLSNMDGLLIGAARQLDRETKARDQRLTARTDILAKAQGINFNDASKGKVKIKISDFGTTKMNSNEIWVSYSKEFLTQLGDNIPVITVTPNSPNITLYISNKTNKGFTVKCVSNNSNFSFDWIAMAKVDVEISDSEKTDHIDDVFYRKSFKIPQGNYKVVDYNAEKKKAKGQVKKVENLRQMSNKIENKTNKTKQIQINNKEIISTEVKSDKEGKK